MEEKPFSKGEEAVYKIYAVVKKNENPALKDDECRSLFKEEVLDLKDTNERNKKIREIVCLYNKYKKVNTSPDKQTDSKAIQCNDESKEIPTGISTEEMFEMLPLPSSSSIFEKTISDMSMRYIKHSLPIMRAYLDQFKKINKSQIQTRDDLEMKLTEHRQSQTCGEDKKHSNPTTNLQTTEPRVKKSTNYVDNVNNHIKKLIDNFNTFIEIHKQLIDRENNLLTILYPSDDEITRREQQKLLLTGKKEILKTIQANLIKEFSTFAVAVTATAKAVTTTAKINKIEQPQAILGGQKVDENDPVMLTVANMEKEMENINNMINDIDKQLIELYNSEYQKKEVTTVPR